jgi:hypothetical protein
MLPLTAKALAPLHEPIMDPFIPGETVHLDDRDGIQHPVCIQFDDVILAENLSLSRLGLINTLLDQAIPGLRLVAQVPQDGVEPEPGRSTDSF